MSTHEPIDWKQHWAKASALGLSDITEIDAAAYTSPEIYQAECDKIFRRTWLLIGRESEVPTTGDFIKKPIYPLETEALIVRDRDGSIKAFHNTCRHRGAALVNQPCGRTNLFRCPYHAWSYSTDGKLKGMPNPEDFPQVERNQTSLKPIHLDIWNGFLFLNFDQTPQQTLKEYLGGFGELYADAPFADYPYAIEITEDLPTNWKNFMDAFNEGYHVQYIHKNTLPMVPSRENPLNHYFDPVFFAPHSGVTVQSNPEWIPNGKVQQFVYATSGGTLIHTADPSGKSTGPRLFTDCPAVNRIGLPNFGDEVANIFPLSQFQILADRYMWFQFWPMGPEKTRFVARMYGARPPKSYREEFADAHLVASTRDIITEDLSMTELQQRGQRSVGDGKLYLGENEVMLRFIYKVIRSYLDK
jgi:phenylpropionate dioxygenase-like ring-hydroxylating dioxygenase large terminal subunit